MSEPAEDTYEEYVKHHHQLRKQLKDANALISGACMLGLPTLDQKAYEAVKAMQLERDALTSRVAALERETIERCAKICDEWHDRISRHAAGIANDPEQINIYMHNCSQLAAFDYAADAIRALALRAPNAGEPP